MLGGGKKKEEKPKVVTMKADPQQAKRMRDAAKRQIQEKGHKVKETRKGVQDVPPRTQKGKVEQAKRDRINDHARKGNIDYGAGRSGSKSEWA